MATIQEEKPAKARSRSRKAEQRAAKAAQKQVEVRAEPDPVSAMAEIEAPAVETVRIEAPAVEQAPILQAPIQETPIQETPVQQTVADIAPAVAMEKPQEAALSGEVLPPAVHAPASQAAGLPAIAQAYSDYTRQSWVNGRVLVERLIAVRSFDEAIEIQGEFAKQAYANFLAHSQRICGLYGEWTQQFFRPMEKLVTDWRIGR
jgi:hypothetical protein